MSEDIEILRNQLMPDSKKLQQYQMELINRSLELRAESNTMRNQITNDLDHLIDISEQLEEHLSAPRSRS